MSWELAAYWLTAIGTIFLGLVAIFQDWLRAKVMRPKLELSVEVSPPACHKTYMASNLPRLVPCHYFRLGVINKGNAEAREVQLYVSAVRKKRADTNLEQVKRFVPMNLVWAITRQSSLPILIPHMPPRFCDLAHVLPTGDRKYFGHDLADVRNDEVILALDLEAEPNNKGHLIERGTYELDVILAAANCAPKRHRIEIVFSGKWYEEEDQMQRDGFGMRMLA